MSARATRFPLFDSLRAIAALSVVLYHLMGLTLVPIWTSLPNWVREVLPAARPLGDAGVAILFAISGFLLYRPYAVARLRRARDPSFRAFGLRRVVRIFPAYWLALLVTALLVTQAHGEVFGPHWVRYWTLQQAYWQDSITGGIGPAWTLTVELAFYAALPLWVLAMRRIPFTTLRGFLTTELIGVAAICVVSATWRWFALRGLPEGSNPFFPRPGLWNLVALADHFAIGMALAALSVAAAERSERSATERFVGRFPWVPWLVAGAAFYGMYRYAASFGPTLTGAGGDYNPYRILEVILGGAFLVPAIFAWDAGGLVRRLLALKPLLWVGMISYGVYLWHTVVIGQLAVRTSLGTIALWIASLALTIVIAAVSWYAMERHTIALGRRLSARWSRSRRAVDATKPIATPGADG